ncbi:HAD family hydrolase [Anaeromicropila herbilytica]|uniref:Phosphoglycolate phosphatase n=1 Tax=Anaeromicropila herbilytica TaxID=2785025 RepID=A0A7R7EJB2_9FIRM|nr:HAD family hydrolase [Anaeromicropila herbilytica]BCN29731.1 phosphoglycolate phosphatase [Anaeromicropila herbilytica]
MYKLAIFDLDGTLANTLESMATAGNEMLVKLGFHERNVEEYKYFVGNGSDVLVQRLLRAEGDKDLVHFEKANPIYLELLEKYRTHQTKLYDGIKEMLDYLKQKGIKIAVLTNKPHDTAVTVVGELFEEGYFDKILGQQAGIKKKPDKEGAIRLAEYFHVRPEECVYVGDTDVDMMTGNAANMYTIGVSWGFRTEKELKEHHAHRIIHQPSELCDLI